MRQILFRYRIPLRLELIEHGLHVPRIPDNHRISHQIEAHRLIGLGFLLFAANHTFIRHEEKIAQRVQGFPFVELGIDASAIVFTLVVAEDKKRFDQVAIFLQGAGEDVLSRIRLQLADEQRRRHPPQLERAGEPQQIIPVPQNEVLPDHAFDARDQVARRHLRAIL
jgi:hypothetical protein